MKSNKSSWSPAAVSPGLEPSTLAFLHTLKSRTNIGSVEDARRAESSMQAIDVVKLPADIEDRTIPGGPKGTVSIRIVRPSGSTDSLPVVMYFHGGGWTVGGKDTHDRLIRELANGAAAAIIFVDYTRSPEAQYPVAIEESYAATLWVAQNGRAINVDPSRLAVAGDSAGGNIATVVAMLAKERGGLKIDFQVLFYPVTDARANTPSYSQFEGCFLTHQRLKSSWDSYAPDIAVRSRPAVSPLQASLDQLKGLPPALIITAEFDPLRDEGEAYAHKLIEAGVQVTATRYLGTIHAFVVLNAIAGTPAARAAIEQTNSMLRHVFGEIQKQTEN